MLYCFYLSAIVPWIFGSTHLSCTLSLSLRSLFPKDFSASIIYVLLSYGIACRARLFLLQTVVLILSINESGVKKMLSLILCMLINLSMEILDQKGITAVSEYGTFRFFSS